MCALLLVAGLASAQQADFGFGFGTVTSSGSYTSTSSAFTIPEKGGVYPNINFDVIFHRRIGFGFEASWRGGQGAYGGTGGQPYRPFLYDFNGVFQPRLGKKIGADLDAGIGVQSTRFYLPYCTNGITCNNYTSTNHFLVHLGGGLRYYFWNHVFIRPEVHYYYINNNSDVFSSPSIIRVGGTIGYTLGPE
jgi:hypothetical protein